jgi:uncharacterized repeat protein (TIGR03806 family)
MKIRRAVIALLLGGVWIIPLLFAAEVPPVPPPAGAQSLVRDTCANYWTLSPEIGGLRRLLVLPAQAPIAWQETSVPGLEPGTWTELHADAEGGVTIANKDRALHFDSRRPQAGVNEVSLTETTKPPTSGWIAVARMPASNHDISAAVLRGYIYIAGGITADWGFPARQRAFDEIWELDAQTWTWSTVAKFARPRIYCATVAFADKIWVLGGDILEIEGNRRTTTRVEIFDRHTCVVTPGPELPFAHPRPLALVAQDRLYVMGTPNRNEQGRMDSIGIGDTAWRREPDGPPGMWALSGATMDDKLYVCVPGTGLAVFDPATSAWEIIGGPTQPRSGQVVAWRGELWMMGGVDLADGSETRIFNPRTHTWRLGSSLPRALAWGAAAVVNDQIVVIGGAGKPGASTQYSYSDRTFVLRDETRRPAVAAVERADTSAATDHDGPGLDTLPAWTTSRLPGTGAKSLPVTVTNAFPRLRLRNPVFVQSVPTRSPREPERLIAIEVYGPISTFPNRADVESRDVLLDLPERFRVPIRTNGLAFHPRFPEVPYIYVDYNRVQPKPSRNAVSRFTVTQFDPPKVDPASERVLLSWPSDGHDGGDLKFGPDGYLYISTGDGGAPGDPKNRGQRVDIITGGVLRIDVDRAADGKNYAVPPDNPFVGLTNVLPEYWAYGLRNAWRMNFNPMTGDLWVGDNGDDSWESVHLIRKGHNFGWSVFEGSHPFKRNSQLGGPNPHATPPVIELSHAEARSVIGGVIYRGTQLEGLTGQFIFGDYVTGSLWAFGWDGTKAVDFRRIANTRAQPLGFGEERTGEVLMATFGGQIQRLVAAPPRESRNALPQRLSETGIFASTKDHIPARGVLPFEINAPMWSNGASTRRLLALPPGKKIRFSEDKEWTLPEGSVVARTLERLSSAGARRIETQIMHAEGGEWQFYTYAWSADQTDAELVPEAGETRVVQASIDHRWRFSSRAECVVCHNPQTSVVLGLTTAQLNRRTDYSALGGKAGHQLTTLVKLGLVENAPAKSPEKFPRAPNPYETQAPINERARSYLHVNCAHCHRKFGVGGRAAFQLMSSLPLEQTGLVNGQPLVALLGPDAKIVAPRNPEKSELFHRMRLKDGGRMPLIGTEIRDDAGLALIREWIEKL